MLNANRYLFVLVALAAVTDAEILAHDPSVTEDAWKTAGDAKVSAMTAFGAIGGSEDDVTQAPPNFDFLGTRGVNFDMDGNRPYITCEAYDINDCPHGHCPLKTTRCYLNGEQTRLGCMAAWLFNTSIPHHDTSSMAFGLKGCWDEHFMNKGECLSDESCTADVRQAGSQRSQRSLFCCCRSHNCNTKIHMRESLHPPTEKPPQPEESREISWIEHFYTTDLYVAFVLVAILVFCVLVFIIIYWIHRDRIYQKSPSTNVSHLPLINSDCNDEMGTLLSVIASTPLSENQPASAPEFTVGELIAQGRFGKILKATRATTTGVQTFACKQFDHNDADSYAMEVKVFHAPLMQMCPYIVRYFAHEAVEDASGVEVYRIYTEFHRNGSLYDYLNQHVVSLDESFRMVTSMMEGLAFLHEEVRRGDLLKPIIVHRDFKSKNVLVKADLSTCISDFGLSMKFESNKKPSGEKETIHTQVGTRRYMSPEVLEGATEFTPMAFRQIDVYAAGLVVWEVLSRTRLSADEVFGEYEEPFHNIEPKLGEFRRHVKILKARPPIREELLENEYTKAIVDTMKEMWYQEPDGRVASGCARERFNYYYAQYRNEQEPNFARIEGYNA